MRIGFIIIVIWFGVLSATAITVNAQQSPVIEYPNKLDALVRIIETQAKIQEVLLRKIVDEMQKSYISFQLNSINHYRLQILIDRLNKHQNQMQIIETELNTINDQISYADVPSQIETQISELEDEISHTSDYSQRPQLLQTLNTMKRMLELQKEQAAKEKEKNRVRQQTLQINLQSQKDQIAEIEEKILSIDRHFQTLTSELARKRIQ